MRYLGAFPSEQDLVQKILPDILEDEPTAFVMYDKFEKKMLQVLQGHEYEPSTDEELLRAFKVLDPDGNGTVLVPYSHRSLPYNACTLDHL